MEGLVSGSVLWKGLSALGQVPEVVESAETFEGNAELKARALAGWMIEHPEAWQGLFDPSCDPVRVMVVADDSGLEVDALGGAPGVHSARYAALDDGRVGNSSDSENNAKLLRLLRHVDVQDRTARFRCVLAVLTLERQTNSRWIFGEGVMRFHGACEGFILVQAAGSGGFGYDPLFRPAGYHLTFAELGEGVKNQLSHRAMAASTMSHWLAGQVGADPRRSLNP